VSKRWRTVQFWVCLVMALVNLAMFFVSSQLHNASLMKLNVVTIACCLVGAFVNWYQDKSE